MCGNNILHIFLNFPNTPIIRAVLFGCLLVINFGGKGELCRVRLDPRALAAMPGKVDYARLQLIIDEYVFVINYQQQ